MSRPSPRTPCAPPERRKRPPGALSANGRKGAIQRASTLTTLTIAAALLFTATATALTPQQLRARVYSTDPYLARIIDREDPSWDPTVSFGGGHNVNDSYGLCQSNPGTKMGTAGADWRTNPWTQLRWCRSYSTGRYGSEAAAWAFWSTHYWW